MGRAAHVGRPKAERKSKAFFDGKQAKVKKYQEIEDLISAIAADIVNGVSRSDIIIKLKEGMYEEQPQPYKESTAINYYWAATNRLKEDRDEDIETLKDKLYSQYYQLYADAMKANNTIGAKAVLDSIAKFFIPTQKQETNIEIDKNTDKINISFGFSDE